MRPAQPATAHDDNLRFGVYIAIVTQNQDPDTKINRIKVKLPWYDGGDTEQIDWVQLVVPMAGNEFGWYAVPDVGDQVMVMFVNGDLKMPVVLGGVWSKPDFDPETNADGKNNFRGYRSRSGHRLLFDDTTSTKVVVADMSTDLMVGVGNFAADGDGPNKCAVHKPGGAGGAGVSISSMSGNLELTCQELVVEAGAAIKIESKDGTTITTGTLSGDGATVKATAGSTGKYQGGQTYMGP